MSDDLIHSVWFGLLEPYYDNAYNEHHKGPYLVLSKQSDYPSYNIVNLSTTRRLFMRVEKSGHCHAGRASQAQSSWSASGEPSRHASRGLAQHD